MVTYFYLFHNTLYIHSHIYYYYSITTIYSEIIAPFRLLSWFYVLDSNWYGAPFCNTPVEQTPSTMKATYISLLKTNKRIDTVSNNLKITTKKSVNKYCIEFFLSRLILIKLSFLQMVHGYKYK